MTNYAGIDPSTKTGLVVMDFTGNILNSREIILKNGIFSTAAEIKSYGKLIADSIPDGSVVSIEGFSFGSKGQGVSTQYGIGFAIRFALCERNIPWIEPTPSQVKKFATGKGNTPKDGMVLPIFRHWGFEHKSDNVRDAYVLAQMSRAIRLGSSTTNYQREVIELILNPAEKKKKGA